MKKYIKIHKTEAYNHLLPDFASVESTVRSQVLTSELIHFRVPWPDDCDELMSSRDFMSTATVLVPRVVFSMCDGRLFTPSITFALILQLTRALQARKLKMRVKPKVSRVNQISIALILIGWKNRDSGSWWKRSCSGFFGRNQELLMRKKNIFMPYSIFDPANVWFGIHCSFDVGRNGNFLESLLDTLTKRKW